MGAADLLHRLHFLLGLDALGDDVLAEDAAEIGDRLDDRQRALAEFLRPWTKLRSIFSRSNGKSRM